MASSLFCSKWKALTWKSNLFSNFLPDLDITFLKIDVITFDKYNPILKYTHQRSHLVSQLATIQPIFVQWPKRRDKRAQKPKECIVSIYFTRSRREALPKKNHNVVNTLITECQRLLRYFLKKNIPFHWSSLRFLAQKRSRYIDWEGVLKSPKNAFTPSMEKICRLMMSFRFNQYMFVVYIE